MKTATPRLLTALIAVMLGFEPAPAAGSPRHFEGPYHVTITPLERVHATVTSTFRFPELDAQEWWAAFPWPPEFEGQPSARVQVRIAEAPFAGPTRSSTRARYASRLWPCTGSLTATTTRIL